MASSPATTPAEYLAALPPERRDSIERVRQVILDNLPPGYSEGMYFGMLGYYVPLERFADTYNGQPLGIAALGNQKNYISLYLMSVYGDPDTEHWFKDRYAASGKKLNMGKSCVRFKHADDLPLDLIGQTIARLGVDDYLARHDAMRRR